MNFPNKNNIKYFSKNTTPQQRQINSQYIQPNVQSNIHPTQRQNNIQNVQQRQINSQNVKPNVQSNIHSTQRQNNIQNNNQNIQSNNNQSNLQNNPQTITKPKKQKRYETFSSSELIDTAFNYFQNIYNTHITKTTINSIIKGELIQTKPDNIFIDEPNSFTD